jgi:peptide/nickel transport system permease protein
VPRFVFLWTDVVLFAMAIGLAVYAWSVARDRDRRATWSKVLADPAALAAGVVLVAFTLVAALDSVHFRRALPPAGGAAAGAPRQYAPVTESVLDALLAAQIANREVGYSEPLAWRGFTKVPVERGGQVVREFPRLAHGGAHLTDPAAQHAGDVARRAALGLAGGLAVAALAFGLLALALARGQGGFAAAARDLAADRTRLPWRAAWLTVLVLCAIAGPVAALMDAYHVLGTDRTGNDVLYQSLKSVRTAFVIGILATVATLPFAIVLGVMAGYLRGWVDEAIQYLYTTLSSVPNVLLIAACVLMVQVFLDQHPELFETGSERADVKIFLLCAILGLTGWAQLCRLIRGETLKLRELEFVQAAEAFGVGAPRIMGRHILPNVMHLVLITTVLGFSELILYEAVLTYVGVGVDPSMNSFGGMINLARSQMSGDPVVWWSFVSAFVFMVTLVLAANLFADGVRDAFDPRARVFRPRLRRAAMS